MNIGFILGIVFIIGVAVWLLYEFLTAPTIEDEHDECVKARDTKKPEIKG